MGSLRLAGWTPQWMLAEKRWHFFATKLICAINLLCLGILQGMAVPPVVSNVRASQRPGTKLVDIYYDVADADIAPPSMALIQTLSIFRARYLFSAKIFGISRLP